MPRARWSASVVLMMAFMVSLGAQCLVGQKMTAAQMACCVGSNHDCNGTGAVQDCCKTERAEQLQLAKRSAQIVPPVAVLTSTTIALIGPLQARSRSAFEVGTTPLKGSFPPKYVLLATFLI